MRIFGVCLLVSLAALSAGCTTATDSTPAGADGGGGAPNLVNRGSFKLNVGPAVSENGMSCPVVARSYSFGAPAPTALAPGQSIANASSGAAVQCSVKGQSSTGPFTFSGSVQGTTTEGDTATLTITDGSVDTNYDGSATFALVTPQTVNTLTSPMPCQLSGINEQVKPGSMWAQFSCSEITQPPSASCTMNGYFVLEDCDGA